jgi:hypothetical protein
VPEEYFAKILADQDREALEQHCIPVEASLWKLGAYRQFLEHRRATLATAVNEFISSGASATSVPC